MTSVSPVPALVLHAVALPPEGSREARVALWAEEGEAWRALRQRVRNAGRAHPFGAKIQALIDAVARAGANPGNLAETRPLYITLPSTAGGPLPSPELDADPPAPAPPSLAPWKVDALLIPAGRAARILPVLAEGSPEAGVVAGDDLRFWSLAGQFALDLAVRQRIAPTIQKERRYTARWKSLLDDVDDARRFGLLGRAAPGSASSGAYKSTVSPPVIRTALRAFVDAAVDGLARRGMRHVELPEHNRGMYSTRAFLSGLGAKSRQPDWGDMALSQVAPWIEPWTRPLIAGDGAPYRLCLRLVTPVESGPDAPWTLEYLLQSTEDPSLLIPALEVWRGRGVQAPNAVAAEEARRLLLKGLESAAVDCPPIGATLERLGPVRADLSSVEAYRFIKQEAVALRRNGIQVVIPSFLAKLALKVKVDRNKRGEESLGLLGADTIFRFDWEVALGDATVSAQEFEELVRSKEPLVQVRGQWVELQPEMVERALAYLKKHKGDSVSLAGAMRMALAPDQIDGLEIEAVQVEDRLHKVIAELTAGAEREQVDAPQGFEGALRPYQKTGVSWMATLRRYGLGACLADDMGLGKTIEVIALLLHDREQRAAGVAGTEQSTVDGSTPTVAGNGVAAVTRKGRGAKSLALTTAGGRHNGKAAAASESGGSADEANGTGPSGPTLLICPTSVVGNWKHELTRFAPGLKVLTHHGATRTKDKVSFADEARQHDVVISSYALLHRDAPHLEEVLWRDVVLDEAQNIKNPDTHAARTARRLSTHWRAALTGTPVENRLADLWSIFQFLNPGYLGSQEDFRREFSRPIERDRDAEATNRLRSLVSPFILRRLKTDSNVIQDLPEKNEMKVYCTLTKEQATLYQAVVRDSLRQIEEADGFARRGRILAALTRLKQVCNHPAQYLSDGSKLAGRSGKLNRLTEMLEEVLANDDRALVFTQFAEMGQLLVQHLEQALGRTPQYLHGGTPALERDKMVARFQNDADGPNVFVLSLKAGGTGLNLTRASHVFHFDRWWNPAVENQATDRAFRIGQNRNVQVHKFVCSGTLEEAIDTLIERKSDLSEAIVGAGETWITEMSTDELRALMMLRADAVDG